MVVEEPRDGTSATQTCHLSDGNHSNQCLIAMKVYDEVKESAIILLIVYECSSNRMEPWGEGDTGVEATHYSATLQNSRFSTPSNPSTAFSCWLFPEVISLDFSLLSQPSPLSSNHESCPSSGPVISVSTLYYRCLTVSITTSSQAWSKSKHTYLLWLSPQVYNLGCQPSPSTCLLKDSLCSFLYAPG